MRLLSELTQTGRDDDRHRHEAFYRATRRSRGEQARLHRQCAASVFRANRSLLVHGLGVKISQPAMTDATSQSPAQGQKANLVALPVGQIVGRYEIGSILGQGGFGITYR